MTSDITPPPANILICATGAAAVIGLPSYILALRSNLNVRLTILMSASAERFLPLSTVALFADRVVSGTLDDDLHLNHVRLATEQNLVVVLPATANVIAAAAQGQSSTLLTTVLLAAQTPVVFLPSMNRVMWDKPAVQRNVKTLIADGHVVVRPTLTRTYELATNDFIEAPSPPTPTQCATLLKTHLRDRAGEPAADVPTFNHLMTPKRTRSA